KRLEYILYQFFFSSRRRHTRSKRDWSSDVCSSDLKSGSGNSVNFTDVFIGYHKRKNESNIGETSFWSIKSKSEERCHATFFSGLYWYGRNYGFLYRKIFKNIK